jgi:poly-gamma-glutamate biosynthesis protein PgsC/CapC
MIVELFLIGLIAGFLFYEFVGISPGGVIAPAYFAMFVLQPGKIGMTLLLSLLVFLVIRLLSSRFILYGRRKLLLALILGFLLKLGLDLFIRPMAVVPFDLESIGYIIPGMIAHEMSRQRVLPTLLSLGIVTLFTFLLAQLL